MDLGVGISEAFYVDAFTFFKNKLSVSFPVSEEYVVIH